MNIEFKQVLTEVNEILNLSDQDIIKKIPYDFRRMIVQNMDKTYRPNINAEKPLMEQEIKPKTKDFITLIYKNYIADETEKAFLAQKEKELLQYRKNKQGECNG